MAGNVVPFKRPAKKTTARSAKKNASKPLSTGSRKGMCQHGFHKWEVCKDKQFDVKQGKLVTLYRCSRCGKKRVKAH